MTQPIDSTLWKAMKFRCIGPTRGGRVIAVAGDPVNRATYYFGAVAGGLWKTTDAGATWVNVSDGFFKTASVSDICVAPSAPNVIYVGMGESTIRTDVSHGDGVYKSTDAGRTWTHLGLADTRQIGKVRVHPTNPDRVYVAALGHAFGPNEERGIFRSTDGGKHWEKILYVSENAGAVDLSIDEQNPQILYATFWEARRSFWRLDSGGPGSGLWKSTDGGDTWTDISRAKGLPQKGLLGKIGVSASPAQAGRVWALVESQEDPGLYRSDDFGASWQLVSDNSDLRCRPWYYMHVFADPQDAETVYVLNLGMWKSNDGGKSFTPISTPHGDNHGLWIDPKDNQRMIQSNDGGACISYNGGLSFSTIYNQLTAQFYRMFVDDAFPYRVYGTQQDNSSVRVPSDTPDGGIAWGDCQIAGTGESGFIVTDPRDSDIVYVGAVGSSPGGTGALQRADLRNGQIRLINVYPEAMGGDIGPKDLTYRFPWTFPIHFSPHNPSVLYTGGNHVFRSTDEGTSWERISPDLTRNDPAKLEPSGGPITFDSSGAEHYCTLASFVESPHRPGELWAGSDDGLLHVSRDNGATWQNVTPADLPEWSYIQTVELSPHDPDTLFIAANRYKLDDMNPYLFKSTDGGASWTAISAGLEGEATRVVREDPDVAGLLYAGSETGLFASLDGGQSWSRMGGNFPVVPVYDLRVKGSDLVIATHGRSFWVLDDLTPLRVLAQGDSGQLLPPRPAYRVLPDLFADWTPDEGKVYSYGSNVIYTATRDEATGLPERIYLDGGAGTPRGALIHYHLAEEVAEGTPVKLEIFDGQGALVRSFGPKPAGYAKLPDAEKAMNPGPWLPTTPGYHRFRWDLRGEGAMRVKGNKTGGEASKGFFVLPGSYTARLTVGETVSEQPLTVVQDPRSTATRQELEAQHALLRAVYAKMDDLYRGVVRLRDVQEQVQGWQKRLAAASGEGEAQTIAESLLKEMAEIEDALILPGEQKNVYGLTVRPRLNSKLSSLIPVIASADGPPTAQAQELVQTYSAQIDQQLDRLSAALEEGVGDLNQAIAAANVAAVV